MAAIALEMRNITKTFPGVKALDQVTFQVNQGEIHALCGENGAGKSTLMKILSGLYPADSFEGEIYMNGVRQQFQHIKDAEQAGIAIIYQELALVRQMKVSENLFLGNEPRRFGIIQWDEVNRESERWLREVGLRGIKPDQIAGTLGIGQQQLVEIAKALSKHAKILILDEPTAALTEHEVEILLNILKDFRSRGVTCIYISHKLNEVFEIADTITVLRDGQTVATKPASELSEDQVISLMVGREIKERFPRVEAIPGSTVLSVQNYTIWSKDLPGVKVVEDVSFEARSGEILGIAGLMGSGRTELVMSLFGAYPGKAEGKVLLDGKPVRFKNTGQAIQAGMALVSEDRKKDGLVLGMSIQNNISMPSLGRFSPGGVIDENREVQEAWHYHRSLRVKAPSVETIVGTLSGGNQQKVVIGKWLMTEPKVLILDEPTRGIDVGAKYEIYTIMNELVRKGVAIIMISSELPEVLGMSHRILVLGEGRMRGEFHHAEATQERIMTAATGGK
ncbi:xylose import ATP-binding protein XylG [Xylanibacillus composti]|uniref:Xylose import ATP-binding protein XylG n=1 Tax=Xylanibacillus composti TaxID=1572762 RepID=A0A8J4H9F5_9BACL|nr:xylose ABC transporter ATP-binding protein [Xylanibacillus composti]GIQ71328.1 xylose import ATP-binding protein XylG [Xylanibacillus composti]